MFEARMLFSKTGRAKFISHLDLMNTLKRALYRADVPVWHTQGFNPHPYVSIALPLSTGHSSDYEILDFKLMTEALDLSYVDRMNDSLPEGIHVKELFWPVKKVRDIDACRYRIALERDDGGADRFLPAIESLFARETLPVTKKSKRSETEVDLIGRIRELHAAVDDVGIAIDCCLPAGNAQISPVLITQAIETHLPEASFDGVCFHRVAVFDREGKLFR